MTTTRSRAALFAVLTCLVAGCGTAYVGNYGVPLDAQNRRAPPAAAPQLLVSAREAATYSTRYLGLVEVTFENRTPVWKQVDRVEVDFGSPANDQSVTIASGDQINAWERATKIVQLSAHTGEGPTAIEALGLGVAVDAFGAVTAAAPAYPEQHLLAVPFPVPPGLFTKRWILISTPEKPPGGCIDSMILSYETSDHMTGRLLLPFKAPISDWQPACGGPSNAGALRSPD
jgi:hypothetical protein